ncbi:MAG: hypothetical protein IJC19_00175 [Clostridia bacterium]|nr:hypothetical protein [Clostridia bacterium]
MMSISALNGYSLRIENRTNRVYVAPHGGEDAFEECLASLISEGFTAVEAYADAHRRFAALKKEGTGVFLNYFPATGDLRAVVEEDCAYFSYSDRRGEGECSAQITQIPLEDFGLSYAIRLPDGRFILLDGGWNFAPDAERLYRCLVRGSEGQKPVVAAWILTHPHRDHYQCFIGFMERYADRVTVEKVLLNFPEADDPAFAKDFTYVDPRVPDSDERTNIPLMWAQIARCGAAVYTAHTGQRYRIGDALCEVLSSFDDVVGDTTNVNATSLVLRMELGGQVILWTADSAFSIARLPQRYGTYLKADILQVPHHGFQSGAFEAEVEGYDLIAPSVCLLPVSDYNAYTAFCIHREGTRHLMLNCGVEELIAGSAERTLTLPYTPPAHAKQTLARRCAEGLEACGAKSWIFTGLNTAQAEDFCFDVLNTTFLTATINCEIFFEDKTRRILHIRFPAHAARTRRVNVVGDEVDKDALWFNEYALKHQSVPENAPFAIRFMSDIPVVISHPNHAPVHRGI